MAMSRIGKCLALETVPKLFFASGFSIFLNIVQDRPRDEFAAVSLGSYSIKHCQGFGWESNTNTLAHKSRYVR